MQIEVALPQDLSLQFGHPGAKPVAFATSHLQRGLLLLDRGALVAEEAVGFGVPVLKKGLQTIFPGSVDLDWQPGGLDHFIRARFKLNRVERLARNQDRVVGNPAFYSLKDLLAAIIRRWPASRRPLTAASSRLRRFFGWETSYQAAGFETAVTVTYRIQSQAGVIQVAVDCTDLHRDVTEIVLMHEQGAHTFDRYGDSAGLRLAGERIGCWDEVTAAEAWFESSTRSVGFKLRAVQGAKLFRGRELIGSRLAWAGFGYSFSPALAQMQHELVISRRA
jgi:hypothetical protein